MAATFRQIGGRLIRQLREDGASPERIGLRVADRDTPMVREFVGFKDRNFLDLR